MGTFARLKEMYWNNNTSVDEMTVEETLEMNTKINEEEKKSIDNEFKKSLRDIKALEKSMGFDHKDLKSAKRSPKIEKAKVNLNEKEKTNVETQKDIQKDDNELTR